MPSQPKRVALAIALACGLAVAAALAFAALRTTASTPADAATSAPAAVRGGTLLTDGAYALEIVQGERDGQATLAFYPSLQGKPVKPAGNTLTATIERYDGTRGPLALLPGADGYRSAAAIPKPHVFEVKLDWQAEGATRTFDYRQNQHAVPLDDQQLAEARIGVDPAGPAAIADSFQLPGEIRFNADRTAQVVPRVAGVVEKVAVSLGQQVKRGELLAVLASPELSDRRSELLTAQRRLVGARQVYERERRLWQERISAQQDYQAAQVQLREAEIAVQNARQKLSAIDASAGGTLNRYELRAPFDGSIVEKRVTPGEAVAADTSIFVLSDLSSVWAEMAVPAQRLKEVYVGKQARVSATAFDSQARGQVAYVGALLGAQTRTAPARIVLPNPGGTWRPGMFVNVTVDTSAHTVPLAVRTDALQTVDGAPAVFVASKWGFVAQPLKTGIRDARFTEVLDGLKPGQRYAASNSFVLKSQLENSAADSD
ncbi:efflux RND transporter periplasmic adaptor subunit [Burkholderia gladioli]|uniref:efflux RND transporter periplasmic adaptor subunit n=1 Tax=Burkholderia gladioli TaxID=28095 RepID=UPI003F791CCD